MRERNVHHLLPAAWRPRQARNQSCSVTKRPYRSCRFDSGRGALCGGREKAAEVIDVPSACTPSGARPAGNGRRIERNEFHKEKP